MVSNKSLRQDLISEIFLKGQCKLACKAGLVSLWYLIWTVRQPLCVLFHMVYFNPIDDRI